MKTQVAYFLIFLAVFYLVDILFLWCFDRPFDNPIKNILLAIVFVVIRKLYRMIFTDLEFE